MNLFDALKSYAHGARILIDWLGAGGRVVDNTLAQSRADVCKLCPHNKAGLDFPEATSEFIREQVELKNHLQLRVGGEKSLFTCEVCLCPIKLKIWLPIEQVKLKPEEMDEFPAVCWLRKESA